MSEERFTAEEQAQFDAMRAADNEPAAAPEQPAAAPAAPSPGAAQPETGQEPQQPQPPKMVRLEALHEERERRRQLEKERSEERERYRLLEERTNLLLHRIGQPQQPPSAPEKPAEPAIPDLATDPVGHILGNQHAIQRQLEQFSGTTREQQERINQQIQQQQIVAAVVQHGQAMERQFSVEHPDYADAVRHLEAARHRELQAVGVSDLAQRAAQIQQEGVALAAFCMQTGRNPAQAIYELAQIRGYASPAPKQQEAETQPESVAPPQVPAARAQLETIAAGQQHARSLGNTSGSGPAPLTAQRLLEMPEAEFAKMLEKPEALALFGA